MKRSLRIALLFPLALLVSSCFPTSENPLCDPKTAQRDEAVVGLWRGGDPAKPFLLDFSAGQGGRAELVALSADSEKGPGVIVGHLFTSKVGAITCMSLALTGELKAGKWEAKKEKTEYFIMRYDLKDGVLSLRMLAEAPVATAIEAGKLKGTKEGPHITDSSENVAKFIAAGDAKTLFGGEGEKPMLFRKVTLPDAPQAPK